MHEVSLAQGLCRQLQALATEHRAHRIRRVELEVGALSNVVPDLLRQAFTMMKESLPLIEEAELAIREVPLLVNCTDCGQSHELQRFVFECPSCKSTRLDVKQGEDLLLRNVELEIEEKVG